MVGFNCIMFRRKLGGISQSVPIIYPNLLVHADVAAKLTEVGAPLEGSK